jgi:alpha-tubulin suppressor-like RCC1 family protein
MKKIILVNFIIILYNIINLFAVTPQNHYSWGANVYNGNDVTGALGLGYLVENKNNPTLIEDHSEFLQIVAAFDYNLAIKKDSTLWGWGRNNEGFLGLGDYLNRYTPTLIDNTKWKYIDAKLSSYGIKADGTLWSWGKNTYGQLGHGHLNTLNVPTKVSNDNDWKMISAGHEHIFALKEDGTLWACGRNDYGQLGDNSLVHRNTFVKIGNDNDWKEIQGGYLFSVAIKQNGTLWSWGENGFGQLGNGDLSGKIIPEQVGKETNWNKISCGGFHTLALKNDSTLWSWGYNGEGQLGLGNNSSISTPTKVSSTLKWIKISTCTVHSFAIKEDYTSWAWGYNGYGQLGTGNYVLTNSPVQTLFNRKCEAITTGWNHSIATIINVPLIDNLISLSEISTIGVTAESNIIEVNGNELLEKGFVVSQNPLPTTNDMKFVDLSIGDSIKYNLNGLLPHTKYCIRAFASNDNGVSYSNQKVFTTHAIDKGRYYISENGSGIMDGSNWYNTIDGNVTLGDSTKLVFLLKNAKPGDEFWIKKGTYYPTNNNIRTISFGVSEGIKIYGGFDGYENSVVERNYFCRQTIFSGDIAGDNSLCVLKIDNVNNKITLKTEINGIIIKNGNSDKTTVKAGGLNVINNDITLKNCIIQDCSGEHGGGIYLSESNSNFEDVVIKNNYSSWAGAGVYNNSGNSSFNNVEISNNYGGVLGGGCIYWQVHH